MTHSSSKAYDNTSHSVLNVNLLLGKIGSVDLMPQVAILPAKFVNESLVVSIPCEKFGDNNKTNNDSNEEDADKSSHHCG